jgi:WD40 repeat protein
MAVNSEDGVRIKVSEVAQWTHKRGVSSVKFSPNGAMIASASSDYTCAIYNAFDFSCKVVLVGHKAGVSDVSWSSDSRFVCTASDDTTMRIWDVETVTYFTLHWFLIVSLIRASN